MSVVSVVCQSVCMYTSYRKYTLIKYNYSVNCREFGTYCS